MRVQSTVESPILPHHPPFATASVTVRCQLFTTGEMTPGSPLLPSRSGTAFPVSHGIARDCMEAALTGHQNRFRPKVVRIEPSNSQLDQSIRPKRFFKFSITT